MVSIKNWLKCKALNPKTKTMKREYFGMIFIIVFVGLIFAAEYIFDEEAVWENLSRYIVIWLLIAYFAGQYSMKFPKAF